MVPAECDGLPRNLRSLRRDGETARQHHDQLVRQFIVEPAAHLKEEQMQGLTASGPPLPVLIRALEILRDYRTAADRPDLETRHADLAFLREALEAGGVG